MTFQFRLTASSKKAGIFGFEENRREFNLSSDVVGAVTARNAETLKEATSFHFEVGGFESEAAAREAAEAFRLRLRLINAVLATGMNVPAADTVSARVADTVKERVRSEQDMVVVDSVSGVSIFPEDGRHFEYVMTGNIDVKPSDPTYILAALETTWPLKVAFDSESETALQILNLASAEASDKASFMTTYLALEPVIKKNMRSRVAIDQLKKFQLNLERAKKRKRNPIPASEADALMGALKALHEESFTSALARLSRQITNPTHIRGMPTRKFLSTCIAARNRLAHNADPKHDVSLSDMTTGIRQLVIALIWSRNKLPAFTLKIPPSSVSIKPGGLSIRVM